MIASLAMYDMAPVQAANDRFWSAIRAVFGDGPASLTRDADLWTVWRSPDLLFAQTCGMPYRTHLHGQVDLVGTPDYGLPDCPPGHYRSAFVVRADAPVAALSELNRPRFAYNEALSQSGWAAPGTHLARAGIALGELVQTGAHAASARAVADGRADLAALDALTWALLQAHDPLAQDLRVLAWTEPTPGLPYITRRHGPADQLHDAVHRAIEALTPEDRSALHLKGLVRIPAEAYLAIPSPPAP